MEKNIILDEKSMMRALTRISHEILEKNKSADDLVIVGIKTRGIPLANIIASKIEKIEGVKVPVGTIDITFYRDDLTEISPNPILKSERIDFEIKDKTVVLVDDVIYTGRTAKAGLDAITDIARPKKIQLAVLVDRGHRELPIRADFVGKNVPTSRSEMINVNIKPVDSENFVSILKKI